MKINFSNAELTKILTNYARERFNLTSSSSSAVSAVGYDGKSMSIHGVELTLQGALDDVPTENKTMVAVVQSERKLEPDL